MSKIASHIKQVLLSTFTYPVDSDAEIGVVEGLGMYAGEDDADDRCGLDTDDDDVVDGVCGLHADWFGFSFNVKVRIDPPAKIFQNRVLKENTKYQFTRNVVTLNTGLNSKYENTSSILSHREDHFFNVSTPFNVNVLDFINDTSILYLDRYLIKRVMLSLVLCKGHSHYSCICYENVLKHLSIRILEYFICNLRNKVTR